MRGLEFLTTAEHLAQSSEESDWRSAASRAYYAVFHHFRELFIAHGLNLGRSGQAHFNLYAGLLHCGFPAVAALGSRLDQLRLRHATGQRTQAREPLPRALDLAERTGAAGLAAEVKRELHAAGARPRRAALTGPDALTAGERRVVALAAEGASNRQIAEHLFITQATVETHLRHAFRKLNITSRAELPGRLRT